MGNCCAVLDEAPRSPKTVRRSSTDGTSKNNRNEVRSGRDGGNSANKMSILRKIDVDFPNGKILNTSHLIKFTYSQLRSATSDFPRDAIIGRGAFGTVFKGWLDEKTLAPAKRGSGMVTAIQKLNRECVQGSQEWQSEIKFLGSLSHPNLVKLLGYCLAEKEVILVYEFMAAGSLEQHLFKKGSQPLSWSTRLKILIGASRGLAFLHTSDKQVIYRDFKASNILLDWNYHAKLSDFGLAKKGPPPKPIHPKPKTKLIPKPKPKPKAESKPSPYEGRVVGTYGYPAPKDVATGDSYGKSDDVYGFGVVLLEMLTGLRAPDRPSGHLNLVESLSDQRKLEGVMDKRLEGRYPPDAALKAARLSRKCLRSDPRSRPPMKEVVAALEQIEAIKQKHRAGAPPARPETTAPPANQTAAAPAKPRVAKRKTTAPPAKRKTIAPPAKPKTIAPRAKPGARKRKD